MEIPDFIIALLSAKPDGVDGRTAIQKLGYLASVKLKKDMGYAADFYGPFSQLLAAHLQSLVETDFVVEKGRRTVRDRTMYSYLLTDDGWELAEKIKKEYPKEYAIIKGIVGKCSRIVRCNFYVLSWAAKVHFVLKQAGKVMTYGDAINASRSFGWKLDEQEMESAVKLLSALGLIQKT